MRLVLLVFALVALLSGCAPGGAPSSATDGNSAPRASKAITVGILYTVNAFSTAGGTTTQGGWVSASEIHSNALVTSDQQTRRPVPRLAEKLPSLDDGSITVLPDGRMRVTYPLRHDVLGHDGVPFTADAM